MNIPLLFRDIRGISLSIIILLQFPLLSYSQTFFGVASSPADNAGQASPTASITPPASMADGDLVVIFTHHRNTGGSLTISTTGGQTWNNHTTNNGANQRYNVYWCRFNGTWAANPVITSSVAGVPLTATMYVFRPTTSNKTWSIHINAANTTSAANPHTITGVTTTLPNTVTMAFWTSATNNTWSALSGAGWSQTGISSQYRNTNGLFQTHSAAYNISAAPGAIANVAQTQSTASSILRSILTWTEYNEDCTTAQILTSATSCVNYAGNMFGSTLSATTVNAPNCAGSAVRDIWYRFVAATTNPTISLSSIGANFTNANIQLLSNNCGGTFTSLFCAAASGASLTLKTDFLTPGTPYFIRVYTTTAAAPVSPAGWDFNICITDPVTPPPFNDNCANAVNLPIWNTCNNMPGTMAGATASAPAPTCAGSVVDVWYKFVAASGFSNTITLSNLVAGSNFTAATAGIELLSGSCGSLTSVQCTFGTIMSTGALIAGNTYYIRVFSTTGAVNGNARFNICVQTNPNVPRFGNSYVNITRKTTGGVVQPGDILEIRLTINHSQAATILHNLHFVDNIPSNTTIANSSPHDSIKIITNEGLTYKKYTLAAGDDAGTYLVSPPPGQYNIRLNLGFGASNPGIPVNNTSAELLSATGQMASTDRPRGGGLLFAIAYRVVVTGAIGDTIKLNPAQFLYSLSSNAPSEPPITSTPFNIIISNPLTLCTNSVGVNSATEFGGTFGSGISLNRPTDLTVPIPGYSFISDMNAFNGVGDGRYAIVKNISPRSSPNRNARRRNDCNAPSPLAADDPNNCLKRMFGGYWYIDGDHTGTNNSIGNNPPDTSTSSGYMLMVNADYVASKVYEQSITNLCPNTYYEFSAWVRNICPNCGIDSTGAQFAGTPTSPASGYVGVYPNLSFALNGVDYYSTGEIDTVGWVKKGFTFKTDSTQTSATFSIRNNSQGGGGNDWVLDDIGVATCFPGMTYSPSTTPNVCEGNVLTITDTVRSIFNNYVYYKWQRSTTGPGGPWVDISGANGTATPYWNATLSVYEYVSSYTIPPSGTTPANDGDIYRLVVASTGSNLTSLTCSYSDPTNITLDVIIGCGPPLKADLLSVTGKLTENNLGKISWVSSKEDEQVSYSIEKSDDGINFSSITLVNGYNNISAETNNYTFTDPVAVVQKAYYRVVMTNSQHRKKYSAIIRLNTDEKNGFNFGTVVNPFNNHLEFELVSPDNSTAKVELIDGYGRVVKTETFRIFQGVNALRMSSSNSLPKGMYILKAISNGNMIVRKMLKN